MKRPLRKPSESPAEAVRVKNYITPSGLQRLKDEHKFLLTRERPAVTQVVAWAAANGDRSENADYQYGRRRLREIDRRINFLSKRMKSAKVTDPAGQPDRSRVWFGASVTVADEDDGQRTFTLVGEDEADAGAGRVSWYSPIARALRGAAVGDSRRVALPVGEHEYEVI